MADTSAFRTYSGDEFRNRRRELGLGRHEVAAVAGLTPSQVARIEQRSKYSDAEYAAMVVALGLRTDTPTAGEVLEEIAEAIVDGELRQTWHGITYGDPVRLIDDPKTHYEFRKYVPPDGPGGEHVVVVEIDDRKVRQTRTPAPWKVLRITGLGVDVSEEATRLRFEYQAGAEAREAARRASAEDRARQLAEADKEFAT